MFISLSARWREFLAVLPPQTRTAWKWDLATGWLAGFYQGCVWTFVFRVARAELHASSAQMAWISAAPAVGFIFSAVWARQMEGRAKLPFCYWTWTAARGMFLLAPLIQTREQFVLLVCLTPLLFSVSNPAYTAVMKDIYPDAHRGRLMGAVRVVANLMTLLTALGVGWLLDRHYLEWRAVFFAGGAIGIVSAWCFSRIPIPPPSGDEARISTAAFVWDTLRILWRNPGYRWFTASVFVSGFGNLMATTLYPIYQVDVFHVTYKDVAALQNVYSIAVILSFFVWGAFLDRRGPLATVLLAIGINLTAPLFYAIAQPPGLTFLYGAAVANGLAMAGVELGYLNTTLLFAEPGRAAQYQALHSSFFGIRGSLAPHCAIPLRHGVGWRAAYLISFAVISAGVGLQMISMRDYRRQAARERRESVPARETVGAE
jgi:MFS family permease